ncbi:SLC13 family permease [bacterium]|nr:SLC13 family permease [bacterium]
MKRMIGFFVGLALFLVIFFMPTPDGMTIQSKRVAAVAILMAVWWICETLPLAATSVIPLVAFPLMGILSSKNTASAYADQNVMLFMGGFFIAMAIQKWNLHQRIALHIIKLVGTEPKRLILGFMIASAFLSMWISNTATTLMMLPIAYSVALHFETLKKNADDKNKLIFKNFSTALMLGIAYSCSIGGIGTLVGTPPNIVFAGSVHRLFPEFKEIGFLQWMSFGVPFVLIFLPLCWFFLVFILFKLGGIKSLTGTDTSHVIKEEIDNLGRMSRGERLSLFCFCLTAFLWIFRAPINLGFVVIPGWSDLFPNPKFIRDSTVAMLMSLVMFAIPVDIKKGEYLLDWEWAKKIPWGILLLFGGGFALASGIQESGLALWIGQNLEFLSHIPSIMMIASICFIMTFLTELTSNTAITTIMMPILAASASKLGIHPYLMMIPATISASCAFMLPVATPPNAIVMGSGYVNIDQMAKSGLGLNLIGVILVTVFSFTLIRFIFI